MKTRINTQSKNEVEELLNTYVVSPLNSDISRIVSKLRDNLEQLETSAKEEIKKTAQSTNGKLGKEMKDLAEIICDYQGDQNDRMKEMGEELSSIRSGLYKVQGRISSDLQSIQEELLQNLSSQTNATGNRLATLETGITANIHRNRADVHQAIDSKTAELSASFAAAFADGKNLAAQNQQSVLLELNRLASLVEKHNEDLQKKMDLIDQNLFANFEEQHSTLKQLSEQIDTSLQTSEKRVLDRLADRYRMLFILSLSFGIINTIGIAILLFCF